jgi:hypothetical protein
VSRFLRAGDIQPAIAAGSFAQMPGHAQKSANWKWESSHPGFRWNPGQGFKM